MGKLQVVVGGQFGSEAKGAVAGYLAKQEQDLLAIRTGGPNAGHTVYNEAGVRFPLRCIPVAAVTNPGAMLAISAGSEVDLDVLREEATLLEANGISGQKRLMVDGQATHLEASQREEEEQSDLTGRIGSTSKGIGRARADRIMRKACIMKDHDTLSEGSPGVGSGWAYTPKIDVADTTRRHLLQGGTVQIEAAQGFGLGLHAGYYPFCTSGDCRAIDALAAVGLSPWDEAVNEFEVWIVFRTYPIRVAGNSGPMYREMTWETLFALSDGYIKPEQTTVTKKVRRVGEWDQGLAERAIEANGGKHNKSIHLALTMTDYLSPAFIGQTQMDGKLADAVWQTERQLGYQFDLLGTSPQTIVDRRDL